MMKRLVIFILAVAGVLQLKAIDEQEVLFTIEGTPITVGEFQYVYNKNSQDQVAADISFDEYLEKFENFKLKVFEAEQEGLDTTEAFRKELAGYRSQLARNYLNDNAYVDSLVHEAYDRMTEDVEVSHILFLVPQDATPKDTLATYNHAVEICKKLTIDNFEQIAREESQDPSAKQNGGYLGWITSLITIYPFESAAYNQPVGTISQPMRTQVGYHIIYVKNRRPAVGEIHVKHIMKACNDRMPQEDQLRAKEIVDSLYALLLEGKDFEQLARIYSDDRPSAENGGDLPWFGLGRMVKDFEKVAFSLSEENIYSKPFKSPFGWHIIKYVDSRKPSFADKKHEIEKFLQRDGRMDLAKRSFINRLKKEYHFAINQKAFDEVGKVVAEENALNDSLLLQKLLKMEGVVFSFADKVYLQRDLAKQIPMMELRGNYEQSVNLFIDNTLIAYEEKNLEHKNAEFRNLMQEYHDGILLFELSNREVWEKATSDTIGLSNYFDSHKEDYRFEQPRFNGYIFSCRDKKIAKMLKQIADFSNMDSIPNYVKTRFNNEGGTPLVKLERGLWGKGERDEVDYYVFKDRKKQVTKSEEYPVVFTHGNVVELPETYKDVKGMVISDYQNYLEAEWIRRLREKYVIKVDERVVDSLRNEK